MPVNFHAYPYRGYQTTEAEYSRLLDAALGGSGLLEALTFTVSGMTFNTGAIDAIIRGHRALAPAGSLGIEAASTARVALICARLNYASSPVVQAVVTYGATQPAPTQTKDGIFDLPLWAIALPANATSIGAAQVTNLWQRLRSPSQNLLFVQSARPANPPVNSIRIW